MKFYILLNIIVLLIKCVITSKLSAQKYCSMNTCPANKSVACLFTTDSNIKCRGKLMRLHKTSILHHHNYLRNQIALGNIKSYKSAKRMIEMKWSNELEKMAEYNVKRCEFSHDNCRNTISFPISGQNLAIIQQSGIRNWDAQKQIHRLINNWFKEYKLTDMRVIQKFYQTGKKIGHFTVMVKDTNTHVGCAAARYNQYGFDTILLACNYADTNIFGRPIYLSGVPTSGCIEKSSNYKGLCNKIYK